MFLIWIRSDPLLLGFPNPDPFYSSTNEVLITHIFALGHQYILFDFTTTFFINNLVIVIIKHLCRIQIRKVRMRIRGSVSGSVKIWRIQSLVRSLKLSEFWYSQKKTRIKRWSTTATMKIRCRKFLEYKVFAQKWCRAGWRNVIFWFGSLKKILANYWLLS